MALNLSPEDQAWLEAMVRRVLAENTPAVEPEDPAPVLIKQDAGTLFFQTELSQKLKPGMWFCTNLQLKPGAPGRSSMSDVQVRRIRENVGCDANGVLQAAAFRGFPGGNTPEQSAALKRAAGSPFVYDIDGAHMAHTLGLTPEKTPLVWSVRAQTWNDFDEWLARK